MATMEVHTPGPRSRTLVPVAQRHSDPTPTHTVSGELHQIRAYGESIKMRVRYLADLLDPSVVGEVTEVKRVMKDSHRILESLQEKVGEYSTALLMEQVTVEAWQAYQQLVKLEERLRGLGRRPPQSTSHVPTGARQPRSVTNTGPCEGRQVKRKPSHPSNMLGPFPLEHSWLESEEESEDEEEEETRYFMSGALPYAPSYADTTEDRRDHPPVARSAYEGGAGDVIAAFSNETTPNSEKARTNGIRPADGIGRGATNREKAPRTLRRSRVNRPTQILAKTRTEVEETCREEESRVALGLHDPDREREGSTTSFFACFVILSGIDDASYCLPKLGFIKIHEVKRLKEWLAHKGYLEQSGTVSRTEKLLHLLFVLQEGCRMETIAVLFSRKPRQVRDGCREAFEGLLEMHSETVLPAPQPVCDHLWKISHKYFNTQAVVDGARQYYGWSVEDVVKVLITLNLYIGRYRRQGRLALSGGCFEWWRSFREDGSSARCSGSRMPSLA